MTGSSTSRPDPGATTDDPATTPGGASSGSAPVVSVIVPFRDAAAHLSTLLAALESQTVPPATFECVLVDNASSDDGSGLARAALASGPLRGRVVACPSPPSSYAARNVGVAVATGSVLAFTDADCRPDPTWVAAIIDRLGGPSSPMVVVAGEVRLEVADPHNPWELFDHAVHLDNAAAAASGRVATANMAVPRPLFDDVGPFPVLTSGGDHLWSRRARARGHQVVFAPEVVVGHPTRATRAALVAKMERTSRGQGEAAARDPSLRATNTLRALGRPWLVRRHLRVARTPAAAGGIALRTRLFLTSAWLRAVQVPAYFRGLRSDPGPTELASDDGREDGSDPATAAGDR